MTDSKIAGSYDSKVDKGTLSSSYRQTSQMFWIKSFNNWIKAVLINKYCTLRINQVKKQLDLPSKFQKNLLHVLDIGCGHGQDISKWSKNSVGYIVGVDVSKSALEEYLKRWNGFANCYDFTPIHQSASKPELYQRISHSYYDITSAQLSLHYMFGSEDEVRRMLGNILENLLDGGYLVLTIPDSCSIVKKMRTFAKKEGDYWVHGNKYFSIRFKSLEFDKEYGSFGLEYGFYLKEAIGSENPETKEKEYWNEFLIELDAFESILKEFGMEIIENKNFLEFYKENMVQHNNLFSKMGLIFDKGKSIDEDFWEIAHLYRVFTAKKTSGKSSYSLQNREKDRKKVSEIKQNNQKPNNYHNSYSGSKDRRYEGGNNRGGSGGYYNNNRDRGGRYEGNNNYSQPKKRY